MKLRTRALAYGLVGLALAGGMIFSGSEMGLLNVSSSGILSVLLTDPPTVPAGVSAVYVTYSAISVHASGFNSSGWVTFPGQGTIDTMRLVNLSQTISSGTVPSLSYDMVAFSISNVEVGYMNQNYTATISSGRLLVPIIGGVTVSSSSPAAALIDIQPTILNLGSQTTPAFTMATGAKALQVPSADVNDSMKHIGNNFSLQGHDWFQSFKKNHSDEVSISSAVLTPNSFSATIANSDSDPVTIRMFILTPVGSDASQGMGAMMSVGSVADSVVFAVQSDGSLTQVTGPTGEVGPLFVAAGYTMVGGASHQFTFSGSITGLLGRSGISSGLRYAVVVMGSGALGSQILLAS